MFTRTFNLSLVAVATMSFLASQASAVPVSVVHLDTPNCDTLFIPNTGVHEIGDFNVFPAGEKLSSLEIGPTSISPCVLADDPTVPNIIVDIRNLTGFAWEEVWYVADSDTTITNYDGEANDVSFSPIQEAFRIDNLASDPGGSHHPLIFENMTPDGIWEIGESWQFILQDYSNLSGLSAGAINSIGVGDASPNAGILDSSGSIIAIRPIPEPSSLLLACLGVLGASTLRRRR